MAKLLIGKFDGLLDVDLVIEVICFDLGLA